MPRHESEWVIAERHRRRIFNARRMRSRIIHFYNGPLHHRLRAARFWRRPGGSMSERMPQWSGARVQRRYFNRQSMRGGRRVRNRALPAAAAA